MRLQRGRTEESVSLPGVRACREKERLPALRLRESPKLCVPGALTPIRQAVISAE